MERESILFVGDQEDGKYHLIPEGIPVWRVAEITEAKVAPIDDLCEVSNDVFKVFEYERRGNVMYLRT